MNKINQNIEESLSKLPRKLRRNLKVYVLKCAIQEGYLVIIDEDHWEWKLSKTLLAYFCGIMWCHDCSVKVPHTIINLWKQGRIRFPEHDLDELFGEKNLHTLRYHRKNKKVPENFQLIENLFLK